MRRQGRARHLVTPRTLLLLERDGRLLLLEGAPGKWWAGRWNGLGGSVEAGEDLLAAARREAREETGLEPQDLHLAALAHVTAEPPVLLAVFRGTLPAGGLTTTPEGVFRWLDPDEIDGDDLPLVPDLPQLWRRIRDRRPGEQPLHLVIDHRDGLAVSGSDA